MLKQTKELPYMVGLLVFIKGPADEVADLFSRSPLLVVGEEAGRWYMRMMELKVLLQRKCLVLQSQLH